MSTPNNRALGEAATLAPNRPYFLQRDEAPAFWLVGILWQILATAAQTGTRFSLMEELCHTGGGPPTHTHTQDEGFYVLEGSCTFHAGGVSLTAGPGTFVHVPRNTGHAFTVDEDLTRLLNFYIPAGFEFILMSIAQPALRLEAPTLEAVPLPPPGLVERLSKDYGQTKVLGLPFVDRQTPETMITEHNPDAPTQPFAGSVAQSPAYWTNDILWTMLATGAQTGGVYSLMEELCPKGSGAPPHLHDQDEGFYVIDGDATFFVGDRIETVTTGGFVWVPRGTVHGFRIDSPTCRLLNVYSPAGFERLIELTAEPAPVREIPPPGHVTPAPEPVRFAALLAEVGTVNLTVADPLRS